MARLRHEVTEKSRRMVKSMAAMGCRHEEIATLVEVTPKTLRKYYQVELDRGAIEANAKVMQSLFTMATSGEECGGNDFLGEDAVRAARERADTGDNGGACRRL